MASVNRVILIGNLGRDPEVRNMPNGDAVANLAVATTDRWTDKATGEKKESTEWSRVSLFGRLAEIAQQYLRKGSQVYIEGKLQTRKYTDKDGIERYATEIVGSVLQMLDRRGDNDNSQPSPPARTSQPNQYAQARGGSAPSRNPPQQQASGGFYEDDVPFNQVDWRF